MRVVLLVLIVLWSATAEARWVGTAEQWADLQSRDGDMDNWFNSLSSKKAGSCCSNFDGRPPEAIVQTSVGPIRYPCPRTLRGLKHEQTS